MRGRTRLTAADPVLNVAGDVITLGDYVKQLRLRLALAKDETPMERGAVLPMRLVQELRDAALVRHEAQLRGWKVSDAEIDAEIASHFQGGEDQAALYQLVLQITGMAEAEYRRVAADQVLSDRLAEALAEALPDRADQVLARIIWLPRKEQADDVHARLTEGADFAYLAGRLSEHPSKEDGGLLGWLPRGVQTPEFDDLADSLATGAWGGPIYEQRGHLFVQIEGREAGRAVQPDVMEIARQNALTYYLQRQRRLVPTTWHWDSERYAWAMDQVQDLIANLSGPPAHQEGEQP